MSRDRSIATIKDRIRLYLMTHAAYKNITWLMKECGESNVKYWTKAEKELITEGEILKGKSITTFSEAARKKYCESTKGDMVSTFLRHQGTGIPAATDELLDANRYRTEGNLKDTTGQSQAEIMKNPEMMKEAQKVVKQISPKLRRKMQRLARQGKSQAQITEIINADDSDL